MGSKTLGGSPPRNCRPRRTERGLQRYMTMNAHSAVSPDPEADRLLALAERCLQEPASRQLDGEIYCAVHYIEDRNSLSMPNLWDAKLNG